MPVKRLFQQLIAQKKEVGKPPVNKTAEEYLAEFQQARQDIKVALYQKLLYKAHENPVSDEHMEIQKRAKAALTIIQQTNFTADPFEAKSKAQDALKAAANPEQQKQASQELKRAEKNLQQAEKLQQAMAIEDQRFAVAKANALYQDYLYQTALEAAAKADKEQLLFDPQGRLVYELTLSDDQQKEILNTIETNLGRLPSRAQDPETVKAKLKNLLGGRTPSNTTLCSLDLSGKAPEQGKDAYLQLKSAYVAKYGPLHENLSSKRASIVASFEESYAHMTLMAKTYERKFPKAAGLNSEQWTVFRQTAAVKIQDKVAEVYKEAVKKATKTDENANELVDLEQLNVHLVQARDALSQYAKKAVFEEVVKHLKGQGLDKETIQDYLSTLSKKVSKKTDAHAFTSHTATGFDYFHTADYLQQAMLISGTKNTAHDKPEFDPSKGEDQAAYRQVSYTYRDSQGQLQATGKVSARVPSPALVFSGLNDEQIITDLKDKFGFFHQQMRSMRGEKHGPVVENLFTSFHSELWEKRVDGKNNRQRTSALYMMKAMHAFNASQLAQHPEDNDFLYVQNIGTNRHTRDLGYQVDRYFGGSPELDDITLSAEMAMLHSLLENSAYLNPRVYKQVQQINHEVLLHYKAYLDRESREGYLARKPREAYFAQSDEGLSLIANIRGFKEELKKSLVLKTAEDNFDDLPSVATNALAMMFANNKHWDIRSGQLAQALSIYIEWASTGGCKSGNERNQDVMARFSLLTSIHERVEHDGGLHNLQEHEQQIYHQLMAFAEGRQNSPEALRAAIAVSIRESNMHGGVAAISREDQGGAAKIGSFSFIQNIESPTLRWAARAAALVPAVLSIASLLIIAPVAFAVRRPIPKIIDFWVGQFVDTNNAADREMRLDPTGASKTQAHKKQDKKTAEAINEVLKEDPFFSIKEASKENEMEEAQVDNLESAPLKRSSVAEMSIRFAGDKKGAIVALRNPLLPPVTQPIPIRSSVIEDSSSELQATEKTASLQG